jgi:hypothetical protein
MEREDVRFVQFSESVNACRMTARLNTSVRETTLRLLEDQADSAQRAADQIVDVLHRATTGELDASAAIRVAEILTEIEKLLPDVHRAAALIEELEAAKRQAH